MIKGLVFDLDGVITETAVLHYLAWKKIVAKIGINFTSDVNDQLKGLSRVDTLKAILKHYQTEVNEEQFHTMLVEKNDLYKQYLKEKITQKDILPNIQKLLDDARKLNLKLSLASSSFNAPNILNSLGLCNYFDFVVNPGSLSRGKPDPEIFIKAAEGVGLLPSECVGFEDAISGVQGIVAAKMFAVAITHNSIEDFSCANLVYESTKQLDLTEILKHANK